MGGSWWHRAAGARVGRWRRHGTSAIALIAVVGLVGCQSSGGGATTTTGGAGASTAASPAAAQPSAAAKPSAAAAKPTTAAASPSAAAKPAASAAASPAAAGASSGAAAVNAGGATVTVLYSEITDNVMPLWYGADKGIFKKYGLNVKLDLVSGGSNTLAALISGNGQIGMLGGSEVLSAVSGGADLVVVGTEVPVVPYVLLSAKDITSVQQLKGKKVGIATFGGSSDIAVRLGLQGAGLNPDKDVTIVATGSHQNRTAALQSGAIQAEPDEPPASFTLEDKGYHAIIDMAAQKTPFASECIVVKRSYLQSHKTEVQAYVDAMVEAIAAEKKDQAGAVQVLMTHMKNNDQAVMTKTYHWVADELVPSVPYPDPKQFQSAIPLMAAKHPKVKDVDVGKLVDRSFMQNAASIANGS